MCRVVLMRVELVDYRTGTVKNVENFTEHTNSSKGYFIRFLAVVAVN